MKLTCFAAAITDQSKFNLKSTIKQSSQRAAMLPGSSEQYLWWSSVQSCAQEGTQGWPKGGFRGHSSLAGHTERMFTSGICSFCTPRCCARLIYFCLLRAVIDTNLTSDRNQIKSLVPCSWGADSTLKKHFHQEWSFKISLGWAPEQNGAGLPNQLQIFLILNNCVTNGVIL